MIVYLGNFIDHASINPTINFKLVQALQPHYRIKCASGHRNKVLRLVHMVRTLLRHRPKLVLIDVYSTQGFWYAVLLATLCRWRALPYINIVHSGDFEKRLAQYPRLCRPLLGKARTNVCPSTFMQEVLTGQVLTGKALAGPHIHTTHIPNFTETTHIPFVQRSPRVQKLLWVRQYHPRYNPWLALKAMVLLKAHGPFSLTMVGPGLEQFASQVQPWLKQHGLQSQVQLLPRMEKEAWRKMAQAYDVFLNTSSVDNMPVTVLEALALGLPVISTAVGGLPALLRQNAGTHLLAQNTPQALALAVQQWAQAAAQHPARSVAAHSRAQQYSWQAVWPLWQKLLQENLHK